MKPIFELQEIEDMLNKHGLETYPGCSVALLESVRTEFGDEIANEVIRSVPDYIIKEAVCYALTIHSLN